MNSLRKCAAPLCSIAAFGYTIWAAASEPVWAMAIVFGLFALMFALTAFGPRSALTVFALLVPLLGFVSRVLGSPGIPVLVFAFLGLACGSVTRAAFTGHRLSLVWRPLSLLILAFASLVGASGLITASRFANFYPWSDEPLREWVVNSVGVLTSEAVNNTLTTGVTYISGIIVFLLAHRLLVRCSPSDKEQTLKRMLWAFVLGGVLANSLALWQFFSDKHLVIGFITGTYTDSNALGVCSALVFSFSLGLILVSGRRARAFLIICALQSIAVSVLARSRAGVLGIVLFLVGFALWVRRISPDRPRRTDLPFRTLKGLAIMTVLLVAVLVVQDLGHLRTIPVVGDAALLAARPSEDSLRYLLRHRLHQWSEALLMCRDFPWSGVGLGAYIIELPNFYLENEGKLFVIDTSGNLFLQIASELGLLGLVLSLILVIHLVRCGGVVLLTEKGVRLGASQRLVACVTLGLLAALVLSLFGAHILFLEYNYMVAFSVAMLLSFCRRSGPDDAEAADSGTRSSRRWLGPCLLAASVTIVSVILLSESLGPLSIPRRREAVGWQFEYGFYRKEVWGDKFPFWWTQKEAQMRITAAGKALEFSLFCTHPDADNNPVTVRISVNGQFVEAVELTRDRWKKVKVPLAGLEGKRIALSLAVDRTFNPKRQGISEDHRDLGVAIARVHWVPR